MGLIMDMLSSLIASYMVFWYQITSQLLSCVPVEFTMYPGSFLMARTLLSKNFMHYVHFYASTYMEGVYFLCSIQWFITWKWYKYWWGWFLYYGTRSFLKKTTNWFPPIWNMDLSGMVAFTAIGQFLRFTEFWKEAAPFP